MTIYNKIGTSLTLQLIMMNFHYIDEKEIISYLWWMQYNFEVNVKQYELHINNLAGENIVLV